MEQAHDASGNQRLECEALQGIADVLKEYRYVWEGTTPARFSFQRFCDAVALLNSAHQPNTVDEMGQHWANDVLLRMLERLEALYEYLDAPGSGLQHVTATLPPLSTLPLDNDGLVRFCRTVHTLLLPLPGATTVRGGFASRMRNLNASLSIFGNGRGWEEAGDMVYSVFEHRRDQCLHLLLRQVDKHMTDHARYIGFQDAYHEARAKLMPLTVDARRAYFMRRMPWTG